MTQTAQDVSGRILDILALFCTVGGTGDATSMLLIQSAFNQLAETSLALASLPQLEKKEVSDSCLCEINDPKNSDGESATSIIVSCICAV